MHSRPAGAAAPGRGGPLEVTVRDPVLLHASRARRSMGPGYVHAVRYSAGCFDFLTYNNGSGLQVKVCQALALTGQKLLWMPSSLAVHDSMSCRSAEHGTERLYVRHPKLRVNRQRVWCQFGRGNQGKGNRAVRAAFARASAV